VVVTGQPIRPSVIRSPELLAFRDGTVGLEGGRAALEDRACLKPCKTSNLRNDRLSTIPFTLPPPSSDEAVALRRRAIVAVGAASWACPRRVLAFHVGNFSRSLRRGAPSLLRYLFDRRADVASADGAGSPQAT
jgi:hypothetical protein